MGILIGAMIYAGSALMVYNIIRCYQFVMQVRDLKTWKYSRVLFYVPLGLLVSFLIGYLIVGLFGNPDLVMAGILLGGSVFVFVLLSIIFEIVAQLRESDSRSKALYAGMSEDLDSFTEDCVAVFRVNLTTDEIEDRRGTRLYPSDCVAQTYTELMNSRAQYLLSDSKTIQGIGLLTREGLLRSFKAGRTELEDTVWCRIDENLTGFVRVRVRMAAMPGSADVIAFIIEEDCNDELVTKALLNKALIGQFDMITYLMDGRYSVVIGDKDAIERGSIFPNQRSGWYEQYLSEQLAPVIAGTEEERVALLESLSLANVEQELATREPYVVNIACLIDGETFYKRFVYYVVDWESRFFLLLKSDTTDARVEEMERNRRLREALEQAQRASASKTTFLSNMSHDIRTPMNAIVGYTDLAERSETLPEVRSYLAKIDASSKYMLALINDVLEMSRIESGKIDLEPEDTDLLEMMGDLHDMFEVQMGEKHIAFTVDSSAIRNRYVLCDRTRLNRVLLNLLSNAYKFTPDGGEVLVVLRQLEEAPEGYGRYELVVRDTGIGMSPEFAEKVFDAFERERNTTTSGIQGTGLGMAITKRIVDMMNGSILVKSEQGAGTEFVVRIQLELMSTDMGLSREEPTEYVEPALVDLEGKRILLAEDNEINQEIACILLEELGFAIDVVGDGRQAVDQLCAKGPGYYDVVITDIQMPVMNGYEEARAIRSLDDPELASTPIVAMSANAFQEDIEAARQAGIDGYVPKPIDVGTVLDELTRVLS